MILKCVDCGKPGARGHLCRQCEDVPRCFVHLQIHHNQHAENADSNRNRHASY